MAGRHRRSIRSRTFSRAPEQIGPGVLRTDARSLRLARQASPRVFWMNLSLSFFSAGLLLVQVVSGNSYSTSFWPTTTARAWRRSCLSSSPSPRDRARRTRDEFPAAVQRLLGEEVQRLTWDGILGVTTRVPLEAFEHPEFFEHSSGSRQTPCSAR